MAFGNTLKITPPDDFVEEEVITSWRMPAPKRLKADKVLQFQAPVRPNMIVTRRKVRPGTMLSEVMAKVITDMGRHVKGLSEIETTQFEFTDGAEGLILRYSIPAHGKFTVVQLQAGRMDGDVFTTMTISSEASRCTEDDLKAYLHCIANATIEEAA